MLDFFLELSWRLPLTIVTACLSSVIGFAVYQWLTYRWHQRLRRRLLQGLDEQEKLHKQRQVCLVLSVGADIQEAALAYLKGKGIAGLPVFHVHQSEGLELREEHWFGFLEKVKAEVRKIREFGATRVFLFAHTPVAMALFVGATLANGPEVVVHHHQNGYFPVGRLTVETVRL